LNIKPSKGGRCSRELTIFISLVVLGETAAAVVVAFLVLILLTLLAAIPFGFGWCLDRTLPRHRGLRIALSLLTTEMWTLLFLTGINGGDFKEVAFWMQLFVFPTVLIFLLGGYFASRWRSSFLFRRALRQGRAWR
jgi:hypothetical protein